MGVRLEALENASSAGCAPLPRLLAARRFWCPRRGADSGALSTRAMGFGKSLTATEAINRLKENDPSFTKCDLGNNAVR